MRFGAAVRTMGPSSAPDVFDACVRAVEEAGLDELWVADHVAIPPDDAEGSGGRYLDVLATLAYLAHATRRVAIGSAVLVLPYRAALPTAKQIATIQELSRGRLLLGVGVGWMEPEFRALGVERRRRGALSDATLALLRRCFDTEDDVVEANGQRFLFRPRPARPPIFVGGAPPHALERAVRHGDGWMPLGGDPEKLRAPIARLRDLARAAGKPEPEVIAAFDPADPGRAADQVRELEAIGVTRVFSGAGRYASADAFRRWLDRLVETRERCRVG